MENLEQIIYEKLLETMDINEGDTEGFTFDSPIFGADVGEQISLGLDSLDALELVTMIYDTWGIDVPAEEMGQLRTVNKIAEYIREHE